MREHASDSFPENSRRASVVDVASSWVVVHSLVEVLAELDFVPEKTAGDADFFASDHNNSLAIQQFLGNIAGKTAKNVALGVNDNLFFEHCVVFFILLKLIKKSLHKIDTTILFNLIFNLIYFAYIIIISVMMIIGLVF